MRLRALTSVLVAVGAGALAARRWLDVVEVRGRSMAPTLLPGDQLVVVRARPRVGDVVVAPDPRDRRRELVKRVVEIDGDRVVLRGDNPAFSTDASAFGPIPAAEVAWRAVARYHPARRAGPIPAAPPGLEPLDEGGEPACAFPEALVAGDPVRPG